MEEISKHIEKYRSNRGNKMKKSIVLAGLVGKSCIYFGKKNHARGDLKCQRPSFATLKIREARNRRERETERKEILENLDGYFRPGSKHSKGKEPGNQNPCQFLYDFFA